MVNEKLEEEEIANEEGDIIVDTNFNPIDPSFLPIDPSASASTSGGSQRTSLVSQSQRTSVVSQSSDNKQQAPRDSRVRFASEQTSIPPNVAVNPSTSAPNPQNPNTGIPEIITMHK